MPIIITGASGFIGKALCERMLAKGWQVRGTVRDSKDFKKLPTEVDAVQIKSIGPDTDWSKALNGVDTAYRNQNIGKRIEERVSRRT